MTTTADRYACGTWMSGHQCDCGVDVVAELALNEVEADKVRLRGIVAAVTKLDGRWVVERDVSAGGYRLAIDACLADLRHALNGPA